MKRFFILFAFLLSFLLASCNVFNDRQQYVLDSLYRDSLYKDSLYKDSLRIDSLRKDSIRNDSIEKAKAAQPFKVLLIGDSMTELLAIRLNDYCIKNNIASQTVVWYGACSVNFGTCDTLSYFMDLYKPDYVMIALGANELFVPRIIENRRDYVQHIYEQVKDKPFVWIGPPNWKKDTGINQLIEEVVGTGHYFDSRTLTYERASDGAHPTKKSAYAWFDKIMEYLATKADDKLDLAKPDFYKQRIKNLKILANPVKPVKKKKK